MNFPEFHLFSGKGAAVFETMTPSYLPRDTAFPSFIEIVGSFFFLIIAVLSDGSKLDPS